MLSNTLKYHRFFPHSKAVALNQDSCWHLTQDSPVWKPAAGRPLNWGSCHWPKSTYSRFQPQTSCGFENYRNIYIYIPKIGKTSVQFQSSISGWPASGQLPWRDSPQDHDNDPGTLPWMGLAGGWAQPAQSTPQDGPQPPRVVLEGGHL